MTEDPKTSGDAGPGRIESAVRILSLLALFFLIGGIFGAKDLQPIRFLAEGLDATRTLIAEMRRTKPRILVPIVYPGSGVVAHDPARASAGLTLVQGILPGGPQVRLIDMAGREIHRWNVDFFAIWPKPDHVFPPENVPTSLYHTHTQGFLVRPDGSILVNVGDKGSVNLDRCGRVLWTVDRMTHHSVTAAPDGGYYIPSHNRIDRLPDRLVVPGLTREEMQARIAGTEDNVENMILEVDAEGRPVREFSVLAAVLDGGLEAAIHDGRGHNLMDPAHLNDIEVVTPELAAKIAGVESGDLLVSLRNMNMLAIVDRGDGSLKWHKRGPWIVQHDPDITPDGRIEVFDNRDSLANAGSPESRILSYDPATDVTRVVHPASAADRFFTYIMGSHQRLPNGNRLIVESSAGRVFEATPDGDVVWSYVLPYNDIYAAFIEHAERVPEGFFTVADWSCG